MPDRTSEEAETTHAPTPDGSLDRDATREQYRAFREQTEGPPLVDSLKNAALIFGALQTLFFIPADWLLFPDHFSFFLTVRLLENAFLAFTYFWLAKRAPVIGSALVMWSGAALFLAMVHLTGGVESGYYVGLILLVIGMGVLAPISARQASWINGLIFAGYSMVPVISHDDLASIAWPTFVMHSFFLGTACLESVLACFHMDRMRFQDFLQKRELERARDELAELDRAKSRFSANVHHELRTPLTLILAPLDALRGREFGELSQEVRQVLDTMHANGRRLYKMINNLLDLSKLESDQLTVVRRPTHVGRLMDELVTAARPLADRKGVTLTMSGFDGLPEYNVDPEAIEKVFVNLVGNALKFTEAGDRVAVDAVGAERALAIREVLAKKSPDRPEFVHALAQSHRQIGVAMERKGKRREAYQAYFQAVLIAEQMLLSDPEDAIAREELAINRINMAENLYELGDSKDALHQLEKAEITLRQLSRAAPLNMRVRRQLATCHDAIARIALGKGDHQGALRSYERARDLRLKLVELEPGRAGWQRDLATSHSNSADILLRQGDIDGAYRLYQEALTIFESLVAGDPTNIRWQMDVAVTRAKIGEVLERRGELDQALAHYRKSLEESADVVAHDPENSLYKQRVGDYHGMIAGLLDRRGQVEQALASLAEKRLIVIELSERDRDNASVQRDLVDVWHLTGTLQAKNQQVEPAMAAWREALAALERLARTVHEDPASPSARERTRTEAELHRLIARGQQRLGREGPARQSYERALALYRQLDEPAVDGAILRSLEKRLDGLGTLEQPPVLNATTGAPDMTTKPLQSRSRKNDLYE